MCTFGFKLTQCFIALRFWHNVSLSFFKLNTICLILILTQHQYWLALLCILKMNIKYLNCQNPWNEYIKKAWRRFSLQNDLISLQNNRRLIEFFSKLFFKSQTCWLLNRVGGSWTVHFLIWLSLLKLCVFCLELKYLFVESNLKGIKMLDHSNSDLM